MKNINIGICHRRVQTGEPCYFVNWSDNRKNNYQFFSQRFACENFKNRLLKQIKPK